MSVQVERLRGENAQLLAVAEEHVQLKSAFTDQTEGCIMSLHVEDLLVLCAIVH